MMTIHEERLAARRAKYHALTPSQRAETNAKHLAWYHRTKHARKDKLAEYDKRSYWKHRDKHRAKAKRWVAKNPLRAQIHNRRKALKKFGITLMDYEAMLASQGGVCAICKQRCATGRKLSVDHCHSTGVVRGLLCANCNNGLGRFRDSIRILEDAARYIRAHTNRAQFAPKFEFEPDGDPVSINADPNDFTP